MKKIILLCLIGLAGFSLLFGNGNGDASKSEKPSGTVSPVGVFPIVDEPLTLTLYREGTPTEQVLDMTAKNEVLKYIADKTNISLEYIYLNPAEGKQKIMLDFAADTYPDGGLLDWNTKFTQSDVMQYGTKEKFVLPLNDYIEEYGDEIKTIFELRPGLESFLKAPDGNIYGIPRTSECGHCMSYPKVWMNMEWLDRLGLDVPETTEELYTVLKAFKEGDPNGNGKKDEIALTGNIEYSCAVEYWIMNSFIPLQATSHSSSPKTFLSYIDDEVVFVADKPEYLEGLKYANRLYKEGLIDPANFTQKTDGLQMQCRSDENVHTVGAYTADHMTMGVDFYDRDKKSAEFYHALPPVAGPSGARYQSYEDPINQMTTFNYLIFDKSVNPEAAFRLGDFFLAEDFLPIGHFGIEGVRWNKPADPNAKNVIGGPLKWVPVTAKTDMTAEEQEFWDINNHWIPLIGDLYERRAMWSPAATPETLVSSYETYLEYETLKTKEYWPEVSLPRSLFMEKTLSEEFNDYKLAIVNHVIKNTSMFITGSRPLDEWDEYVDELNKYGKERYVEIYAQEYAKLK